MFDAGDVVRFHSPQAGKEKFHLCLGRTENSAVFAFLFLNSRSGFRGDCILEDGRIAGLPKSATGETVVSFSQVVRMRMDKLQLFGAVKTGAIDSNLAGELAAFAKGVKSLNKNEKILVISSLESLFD